MEKNLKIKHLRHLWKQTDGKWQSQAEGSETHETVDRQDEPPVSLQEREPDGTQTRNKTVLSHASRKQQVLPQHSATQGRSAGVQPRKQPDSTGAT